MGVDTPAELAKRNRNIPPISNAGVDQTITLPVSSVSLDGTKSSDKDGRISSWKWSKKSGPIQYALTTPTASKTDATSLVEGVYVFTLTVTDNKDGAASDDVQITVLKGTTPPPAPTLTGFSPTSGAVGTTITITGTNFASPTVSFNGTAATVTASTSTSITTTVPNGATTGKITIVSGGVTLTSVSNFTLTLPQPTVTSFTPTSGVVGTAVTITGTNFSSPTVTFNGVSAVVGSSTTTSITTSVPTGATTGLISVTSNGTTVYSSAQFSVTVPPPPGELYFSGDMSTVSLTKTTNGYKLNGWPDLETLLNSRIYFNDLATSTDYAYQEMVQDPAGSGRQVLMGRIINDDPNVTATSRAQLTLDYSKTYAVHHTSHRMYIHPDLKYLEQYNGKADWFSLQEMWAMQDPNMDGDPAGSARWGLSLHKDAAIGSPFYWHLYGEYMQPQAIKYQDFWAYDNKTYVVPFGKWFTLDIYFIPGEGSAGSMKITVTPDGGTATTIFDITGTVATYPGRPDLFLDSYQPFKLYIGDPWLSWMTNNGKYMAIYYNDYKWYKN
jgi:hypothetical protein